MKNIIVRILKAIVMVLVLPFTVIVGVTDSIFESYGNIWNIIRGK